MCNIVYLPAPDYNQVESIAELEATFGLPVNDYHSNPEWITHEYDKDVCLCNVDLEVYLTVCGARWGKCDDWPGDILILEMPPVKE